MILGANYVHKTAQPIKISSFTLNSQGKDSLFGEGSLGTTISSTSPSMNLAMIQVLGKSLKLHPVTSQCKMLILYTTEDVKRGNDVERDLRGEAQSVGWFDDRIVSCLRHRPGVTTRLETLREYSPETDILTIKHYVPYNRLVDPDAVPREPVLTNSFKNPQTTRPDSDHDGNRGWARYDPTTIRRVLEMGSCRA